MNITRHIALGPAHFTVTFDAEGVADTIHRNGKIISAAHRDAQRILRNADTIHDGELPRGFTPGMDMRPRAACKWFLNCTREATTTVPHPILGDVPCCARCAALATA